MDTRECQIIYQGLKGFIKLFIETRSAQKAFTLYEVYFDRF